MESATQTITRIRLQQEHAEQRIREQLATNFLMALPEPKGPAQATLWRLRKTTSPLALEANRRAKAGKA